VHKAAWRGNSQGQRQNHDSQVRRPGIFTGSSSFSREKIASRITFNPSAAYIADRTMAGKKAAVENTKKAAGNAKKAEAAAQKAAAENAKKAAEEEQDWSKGAKSNAKK
jgi:hypothetical protein